MRSNQVRKLVYVIGMGPGNFEQMTESETDVLNT